ncbi:hypothetical protein ACROYT_G035194 [Oculina patagonica]
MECCSTQCSNEVIEWVRNRTRLILFKWKIRDPYPKQAYTNSPTKDLFPIKKSNVAPGVGAVNNVKDYLSLENNLELSSRWNNKDASTNGAENGDRFHQTTISTKTRFDLDKCSSFDKTKTARTRVYYRKTKYRKLEQQNDLSPEIKRGKHRDNVSGEREENAWKSGHKEHSPSARTYVVHHSTTSPRMWKKVRVYDWYLHKFIS